MMDSKSKFSINIPIFPLNTLLIPYSYMPLQIFEDRYHKMLEDISGKDNTFGISLIKSGQEVGIPAVPYRIGTIAKIIQKAPVSGGRVFLSVFGQQRFYLDTITKKLPYLTGDVRYYQETEQDRIEPNLVNKINETITEYIRAVSGLDGSWRRNISIPSDPIQLSYFVLEILFIKPLEKQRLLEVQSVPTRLKMELEIIENESKTIREILGSNQILTKRFHRN